MVITWPKSDTFFTGHKQTTYEKWPIYAFNLLNFNFKKNTYLRSLSPASENLLNDDS